MFAKTFDLEDKPIVKAAYENLRGQDFSRKSPCPLGTDQAGTRVRRILEKITLQERTAVE